MCNANCFPPEPLGRVYIIVIAVVLSLVNMYVMPHIDVCTVQCAFFRANTVAHFYFVADFFFLYSFHFVSFSLASD